MKILLLIALTSFAAASSVQAQVYVSGRVGVRVHVPIVTARVVVRTPTRIYYRDHHPRHLRRYAGPVYVVRHGHDRGLRRVRSHGHRGRRHFVRRGVVRVY